MRLITCLALSFTALLLAGCATAPLPAEPVPRGDTAAVQRQLSAYIAHELAAGKIAGLSIALVDDQRVVWAQGFGFADKAAGTPAGPDTLYRMGSISKLFTNTAAMQLVAEGRLALDAPVQQVLPWFRIGSAWPEPKITLRGLMTHHAGLPRDLAGGMWLKAAPTPERDFRAALRALADEQLHAPPGLAFSYSNLGLDLVGAMVEAASGEPFEERLQRRVLAPLGMRDALIAAAPPAVPAMARGHFQGVPQIEPALRDVPAGGLTASVSDMARFAMLQFAGGRNTAGEAVLPEAWQREMLRVQNAGVALDADFRVGLGWMLTTFGTDTVRGGGPVAHHAGATLYHRSQLMVLPDARLGVVVAANDGAAGDVVNRVAQRALALLLEAKSGVRQSPAIPGFVPPAAPWTSTEWAALQRDCAGDYITLAGLLSLRPEGDRLVARVGDRAVELREGEGGRFGIRYRWLGLLPVSLGALSEMGFECRRAEGRQVLFATLDGERLLAGERLPTPPKPLPAFTAAWLGQYRAQLQPGEVATLGAVGDVQVLQVEGRLWVAYSLHPAFGGQRIRALLRPESVTTGRLLGPLADTGPVMQVNSNPGQPTRARFSGWDFERVGD
jgi:CubicO group peptidase (beta-lactamase class C family)